MTESRQDQALPPWGRFGKPSGIVPGPQGHLVVDLTDHGEPWPEEVRQRYADDVAPEDLDDYIDNVAVHAASEPDGLPGCQCAHCRKVRDTFDVLDPSAGARWFPAFAALVQDAGERTARQVEESLRAVDGAQRDPYAHPGALDRAWAAVDAALPPRWTWTPRAPERWPCHDAAESFVHRTHRWAGRGAERRCARCGVRPEPVHLGRLERRPPQPRHEDER